MHSPHCQQAEGEYGAQNKQITDREACQGPDFYPPVNFGSVCLMSQLWRALKNHCHFSTAVTPHTYSPASTWSRLGGLNKGCLSTEVLWPLTYTDPKGIEPLLYWALLEKGDWARGTNRLTWHRGFWLWLLRMVPKKMSCAMNEWEGDSGICTAPPFYRSSLA